MMRLPSIGLAFLAFAIAWPAAGTSAAQDIAVPTGQWVIDYADARCSLARRSGDATSPILVLGTYLGGEGPQLLLLSDGSRAVPERVPAELDVLLMPSGERVRVQALARRLRSGPSILMQGLEDSFVERFAAASGLAIESNDRRIFEISLPGTGDAVAALKVCDDDLLRTWGVDPAAQAALRRPAQRIRGRAWIRDSDYPAEAIRQQLQGTTVMRLVISPEGRAIDCVPVSSSGSAVLDQQSCSLTLERARFEPALDANGEPVASSFVQRITWRLPE